MGECVSLVLGRNQCRSTSGNSGASSADEVGMTVAERLRNSLAPFEVLAERNGFVSVPTHCLYPSKSSVVVYVSGGEASAVVSDEGGAIDELSAHNRIVPNPDSFLRRFCRPSGLVARDGIIHCHPIEDHQLLSAVVLVANASSAAAHWGLEHLKHRRTRDLRQALLSVLERRFSVDRIDTGRRLQGKSTRTYRFGHVVRMNGERLLVVDSVIPDPSSINAHAVAHLDLGQLGDHNIVQRIVYDEQDEWRAADLNLLQMATTLVPFSRFESSLDRLRA